MSRKICWRAAVTAYGYEYCGCYRQLQKLFFRVKVPTLGISAEQCKINFYTTKKKNNNNLKSGSDSIRTYGKKTSIYPIKDGYHIII